MAKQSQPSNRPNSLRSQQLPSNIVAKEFGEVNVANTGEELHVEFTILMEPQGQDAEGWKTGVALDASASMKSPYGRKLKGKVPPDVMADYEQKQWVESRIEDGNRVKSFKKEAYQDAIQKGYFKTTPNTVQSLAQQFTAYLAGNLDVEGGTSVIYWACGNGAEIEILGDFTASQCATLNVNGPNKVTFGEATVLTPAFNHFVERFVEAKRGMYIFLTDGRIDDLEEVKQYTTQLAQTIAAGKGNYVKAVLIGVGDGVDVRQLEELDDLDTGTDVDIWDYKIAREMQALLQIFAEVVDENQIVASTGIIYDDTGKVVKKYTDGLPAKVSISLPANSEWFELEVYGQRIRQTVLSSSRRN
ncbi:MAG: VWA domain-containing protein [Coleofasciculus chthonoplastes F3-SA18-01]|uniref:vWA domain-containing protein n=1 Tax=Coleofasciculus chthonoplastes TaxID=64178 RepID=UPI0033010A0A